MEILACVMLTMEPKRISSKHENLNVFNMLLDLLTFLSLEEEREREHVLVLPEEHFKRVKRKYAEEERDEKEASSKKLLLLLPTVLNTCFKALALREVVLKETQGWYSLNQPNG